MEEQSSDSRLPPAPPQSEVDGLLRVVLDGTSSEADRERVAPRLLELARTRPEVLLPHIVDVSAWLDSATAQVRNGSLQTLAVLSRAAPSTMAFLLPKIHQLLAEDPGDVIGDQALEILTNYAKTSKHAAERVVTILTSTIDRYGTRNATKALQALTTVFQSVPKISKGIRTEASRAADRFQSSVVEGLRSASRKLMEVARKGE